jgi:mono/diheme cytochrome c family protein
MRALPLAWVAFCLVLAACGTDMYDQPRIEAYQQSSFFADGQGSRDLVPGVVSQNDVPSDASRNRGTDANGENLTEIPLPVNEQLLARGQQRYNIYCSPCHGVNGDGRGIVAPNFRPRPPSFYTPTLQLDTVGVGHYFNVITNGYGAMYSYGYRVPPDDRWAIIAYIQQLQANPPPPPTPAPAAAPAGATPAAGATPPAATPAPTQ